jgi:hypothetical protein
MFRKIILYLGTLVLAACSASPTPIPTPSEVQLAAEEQAVYAAALAYLYGAPSYVILSTTATSPLGVDGTSQTLDHVLPNMPDVLAETGANFLARNAVSIELPADMDLGAPYVLLSQQQQSDLFSQNQDGWQIFYDQHPDAPGITNLSRPGFDPGVDQALLYIGTQSHWLAGAGYFLLLVKTNGAWKVQQQVMTWIS